MHKVRSKVVEVEDSAEENPNEGDEAEMWSEAEEDETMPDANELSLTTEEKEEADAAELVRALREPWRRL